MKKIKEESRSNCPGCGCKKPFRYPGHCFDCEEGKKESILEASNR